VPFAMCGYGKLHINRTALLMFGPDLKRMSIGDIPDKNEFLVVLEGGTSHCSVTFRRLEGDIFALEDSTSDITTAEEVAWWAAIGKAWTAVLDLENRAYRRCGEEEAERLRSEKNVVHPCEWGGELLGYFCVDNKGKADDGASRPKEQASASRPVRAGKGKRPKKGVSEKSGEKAGKKSAAAENDALNILGPQTLGLLVPGMPFPVDIGEDIERAGMEDKQNNEKPKKQQRQPKQQRKPGRKSKVRSDD